MIGWKLSIQGGNIIETFISYFEGLRGDTTHHTPYYHIQSGSKFSDVTRRETLAGVFLQKIHQNVYLFGD